MPEAPEKMLERMLEENRKNSHRMLENRSEEMWEEELDFFWSITARIIMIVAVFATYAWDLEDPRKSRDGSNVRRKVRKNVR